jgi:purine-binding chemotaxis protein CheW
MSDNEIKTDERLAVQNRQIDQNRDSDEYLTFELAGIEYGVPIKRVREIIGLVGITRVPGVHECFKGVFNLRGKVIPVIDLRRRFGLKVVVATKETCIIVADVDIDDDILQVGFIVDRVTEVLDIEQRNIEESLNLGSNVGREMIQGVGKVESVVVVMLDIDKIVPEEMHQDHSDHETLV